MADYKSILFEQMIKDFAENEVKPLAQEVDEQERFPAETVEKMAKLGLMRIEHEAEDFYMPYEENEPLIERDLIKVYYSEPITDGSTVVDANIRSIFGEEGGGEQVADATETAEVAEVDARSV